MNITRKAKIYIAGPMTGYRQFNFPAFFEAEEWLETNYEVISPARHDIEIGIEWKNEVGDTPAGEYIGKIKDTFRWDMNQICDCSAIYMLTGWERSNGARAEWALAVTLGLTMVYQ